MSKKNTQTVMVGAWSWGCGFAGGDQVFGQTLDAQALRPVVNKALDLGLTQFDTAAVYGAGASETIVGELLADVPRENVFLSTKFTPQIATDTADPVETMFEESLKRLRTDYIDLYWIHNSMDVERWTPMVVPLIKSGRVRSFGVSNHSPEQLVRVCEILDKYDCKVSAVQNHLSLLHRTSMDDGMLEFCHKHDIDFYAYMVLEQGALTGRFDPEHPMPANSGRGQFYNKYLPALQALNDELARIGARHSATVAQTASAWAIAKGTIPILGMTKVRHAEEAAQVTKIKLSAEDVATLEACAKAIPMPTLREWEAGA
ncbi:MAG: aldo/keto reductase [Sutterellaceae bacterium]|nr:aldo/keto reductase [Sutterellaceae bacterium]